ncbi:MAG TPA: cation diffusion facilitator family transporter [Candidatus Kapabacteria bacterium]|nr:cation diffusion facilitator family transporter [Candidatus Kapabacteria bacterium]
MSESHPHHSHQAEALEAAWISIIVTIVLVVLKVTAGIFSGSLALLSLASESAVDLFSVLLSLFAVRIAYLPADEDHQYGHGKFDSLVSLFQSIALLGVSVWIFIEAVDRLSHPALHPVSATAFTFIVLIISIVLDGWRSYKLHHTGIHAHSSALQTDALHFFADSLSNIVVIGGIIAYVYLGVPSGDNYAAMCVSVFVAYLSSRQGKQAIDVLTDKFAGSDEQLNIVKLACGADGVLGVRRLRMRRSGPTLFLDGGIEVNRVLPFASVEYILQSAESSVRSRFPEAEINFYPIAVRTEGESAFETIKLIASEHGVLPHNIDLAKNNEGKLTLDLHLEFRKDISFEEAHTISSKIENKIKRELPGVSQIVVHLEEERSDTALHTVQRIEQDARFETDQLRSLVIGEFPVVKQLTEAELLRDEATGDLKLTSVIELDRNLSLYDAHDVSANIEKFIRSRYPEINRIIIHVEPQ